MIITDNCLVEMEYKMYFVGDDEVVESFSERNPLEILIGSGEMLESFEKNLRNKKPGDILDFTISKEDAFGEYDAKFLRSLPKHLFFNKEGEIDNKLIFEGTLVTLDIEGEGNKESQDAFILEINDEDILVDLNHPYAGEDLRFKVQVLSVRLVD